MKRRRQRGRTLHEKVELNRIGPHVALGVLEGLSGIRVGRTLEHQHRIRRFNRKDRRDVVARAVGPDLHRGPCDLKS